jgi:hypothetical protein
MAGFVSAPLITTTPATHASTLLPLAVSLEMLHAATAHRVLMIDGSMTLVARRVIHRVSAATDIQGMHIMSVWDDSQ